MNTKGIIAAAQSIRSLSMDAVQKAASGHPGLPLGCAELAVLLYGEIMKHNPTNPHWMGRDRFVLSAGHGSMLLYSVLHLAGYDISLEDIKNFRQLGSICSGHPEYGLTAGVENTSGPLGQGIAIAVGMAIAQTMMAAKYNTKDFKLFDHYTYALVGEGCLEEGVSSEASSLAGHLKLDKLIVFYDQNKISIDGSTDITFTEDIAKRYEAYNWRVLKGDMYDINGILKLVAEAKKSVGKPTLIMLKSIIGKGAPKAGTSKVHGEPLGEEDVALTKKNLGLDPAKFFYVNPEAYAYFADKQAGFIADETQWQAQFKSWGNANPELLAQYKASLDFSATNTSVDLPIYSVGDNVATRVASCDMISYIGKCYDYFVGGSADLKGSNKTAMTCDNGTYSCDNRKGRAIEYGVREFAMADIASGIALHGGLRNFCATYLVFCDYMKAAMRLTSIMKLPVIYVLTHDSIFVGEDGSTHQPIEQLAMLRATPDFTVLRPGDAQETVVAWQLAFKQNAPVALVLTRQKVPVYAKDDKDWKQTITHGAYIVKRGGDSPDVTVFATGSEVSMALEAANISKKAVRVVSVLNKGLYEAQDNTFKQTITGNAPRTIVVEAASRFGWEGYVKSPKDLFTIDTFGTSAPAKKVAEYLGFTAQKLADLIAQ